jgi:hypothetical protein
VRQALHKNIAFITIAGLTINALLLLMSIVFVKERILFLDSGIYLFEIINQKAFYFPYRRFVNVFNQFLPWMGVQLHLKTGVILLLYSINLQLLFTVIYLVIHFGLKQKKLAFAIPLFQLMICYESFFLPVSELSVGIAFLILWLAVVQSKTQIHTKWYILVTTFLALIIAFSHPVLVIPLLFILIAEFNIERPDKAKIAWLAGTILVITVHTLFFYETYESERTSDVLNSLTHFTRYELVTSFYATAKYILHFPLFIFAVLISMVWLIQAKKWGFVFVYGFAVIVCIFAISLYLHKIYFIMPFFEIYLLPLSFLTVFVLMFYVPNKNQVFQYVFSFLMIFQIGLISYKSAFFKERLAIYDSILHQMNTKGIDKGVSDFFKSPMRKFYSMYDTPYTPLLISNMDENLPDLALTLFVSKTDLDIDYVNQYKDYLFVGFDNKVQQPLAIEQLNSDYFSIDTTAYQIIEFDYSAFE